MRFFKFTTNRIVKRLRWVMVGAILFDDFITLLGQPNTYWQHPKTAVEINQGIYHSLSQGLPFYLFYSLVIVFLAFLFVSILPRRIGLIAIFTAILNHYFGASTWLCYHWNFGPRGAFIYGIILSVILVLLVFPTASETSPEKPLSHEPDA
jgi:hypothetical protein